MIIGNASYSRVCRCAFTLLTISFSALPSIINAQATTYFATAEGKSGESLKSTLYGLIKTHTKLSYTPGIWNAHKDLYEDPENPNNLILFYSQKSFSKSAQDPGSGSEQYWNREHLWPNSYGIDGSGDAYTDLFHLVPANKAVNNDRSNQYFDYSDPSDGSYQSPANPFLDNECTEDSDSWEPADPQKGWASRAMFYMDTCYISLELVDTPPAAEPSQSGSRMAQLHVLLDWNRQFLPTEKETVFNQRVYDDYQHNRNPFIDFPEFADAIWVGKPSWGAWRLEHFTLEELKDDAISGDLADTDKDGLSNLLEMALYSDPKTPDFVQPLSVTYGSDSVTLIFSRVSSTDELNLELNLEESENLTTWDTVSLSGATIITTSPTTETVTLNIPSTNLSPVEYFRLTATRPN